MTATSLTIIGFSPPIACKSNAEKSKAARSSILAVEKSKSRISPVVSGPDTKPYSVPYTIPASVICTSILPPSSMPARLTPQTDDAKPVAPACGISARPFPCNTVPPDQTMLGSVMSVKTPPSATIAVAPSAKNSNWLLFISTN